MSKSTGMRAPTVGRRPLRRLMRGQAMIETAIIGTVLILLVFGAFQFALIYKAKITLNYATFEAARIGAVNQAQMTFIENAFANAMAALYTNDDNVDEIREARCRVRTEIYGGDPYNVCTAAGSTPSAPDPNEVWVNIEMLNPLPAHFEVGNHGVSVDAGFEIPNDNLMYRPPDIKAGVSIQDANLLKIRVTYCYPMIVPLVNRTIGALINLVDAGEDIESARPDWNAQYRAYLEDEGDASFRDRCLFDDPNPRIPLNAQAIVRMQSPALLPD